MPETRPVRLAQRNISPSLQSPACNVSVTSLSTRATVRFQKLGARRAGECLDRADFATQGRRFEKQRLIAGEGHMRKHVLQILGEAQGVGLRRQQGEDRVERVLRAHRSAIVGGEPGEKIWRNVERTVAGAIVPQREGIAAVAAAKGSCRSGYCIRNTTMLAPRLSRLALKRGKKDFRSPEPPP